MKFSYTSIDRIFVKFERDIGKDFNEDDIIEWSGEALDQIGALQNSEDIIAFIEVKNHQCEVPKGTQLIRQIARDNSWSTGLADLNLLCPKDIITQIIPIDSNSSPAIPVALDCNGTPIHDFELAYYRPYFDIRTYFGVWSNSPYYKSRYTPVKLSNNSLYDKLVCKEGTDSSSNFTSGRMGYYNQNDSYTVIQKKILRFSFREGFIAVSYTRQIVDEETGYPMIPDDISVTQAIVAYINFRMCTRDVYASRQGSEGRYNLAKEEWTHYCGQAGNKAMMPQGEDEFQQMYEARNHLVPLDRYYGYFGLNGNRRGYHANNRSNNNHIS